jgi:hypothetical protein
MMESMLKLPDDMYRYELLPYLTLDDIANRDEACMNHQYRSQLVENIDGVNLNPIKITSLIFSSS